MGNLLTVNKDLPVDNADILNGTILDSIPGPGLLLVFLASSQRDGILSIQGAAVVNGGTYKVPPVLRASGIPDVMSDLPYIVPVKGGKAIVDYDEVTPGDAFVTLVFMGE